MLEFFYNKLFNESLDKFKNNYFEYDKFLDSSMDKRYGITLVIRPSEQVKENILKIQNEIKKLTKDQYFYPLEDLHITLLPIISCEENFSLDHINIGLYIKLIENALNDFKRFKIEFKGITASASCLMIKGFPVDNSLENIRDSLRKSFKKSDLYNSIDKRYILKSAHITFLRFKNPINNVDSFIDILKYYQNIDLGFADINQIEIYFNDWYFKSNNSVLLYKFKL